MGIFRRYRYRYLEWDEFLDILKNRARILFITNTAESSIKNYWGRQGRWYHDKDRLKP